MGKYRTYSYRNLPVGDRKQARTVAWVVGVFLVAAYTAAIVIILGGLS